MPSTGLSTSGHYVSQVPSLFPEDSLERALSARTFGGEPSEFFCRATHLGGGER